MQCPKCQSQRFVEYQAEGVHLDFCRDCKALWFDQGELAFYAETTHDVPKMTQAMENAVQSKTLCPRCTSVHLRAIRYLPEENLWLDACPQCRGILLEPKEVQHLEQLVAQHRLLNLQKIFAQLDAQGFKILNIQKLNGSK